MQASVGFFCLLSSGTVAAAFSLDEEQGNYLAW
jgi:hypothetical protein